MAAKEASIKITTSSASFLSEMNKIGDHAVKVGGRIKAGLGAGFKGSLGAGMSGFKDSIGEVGGKLKDTLGQAATLGGGLGFGLLVNKALDFREQVRDIEFQVSKTGKAFIKWQDLMTLIQTTAMNTGNSSEDLASAFSAVFGATGDLEFTKSAIEVIGNAAQATGAEVSAFADVAQILQRKFGATAETLPDMLTAFVQKTDAGGLSLDALGSKFALMAGEASEAGFGGTEGLRTLLGMMETLDSRIGEKTEPSMKKLFQVLKNGSRDLKALSKESGLKFAPDSTAIDKIKQLMASTKGRKVLAEKLGGDLRVVFDELAKPFDEAAAEAAEKGAKTKEATQAGLAAFDAAMAKMGEATLDYQTIVEGAQGGMEEDPKKKIEMAIEKIAQSFQNPKMMNAIDKLSELLPELTERGVKLLDFVMNHPILSGVGFLAARGAMGAAAGAGQQVMSNVGSGIAGALKNQGIQWGADFGKTVSKGGWWKAAGGAFAVAGAGILAVELTKALVDARMEQKEANQKDIVMADVQAGVARSSGNVEKMQAAKQALEANIQKMKADRDGIGGKFDTFMGGLATFVDPEFVAPEQKMLSEAQAELAKLNAAIADTTAALEKNKSALNDMGSGAKKAGQAAGQAASQMSRISPSGPTETTGNGVSKGPGGNRPVAPGHSPGFG